MNGKELMQERSRSLESLRHLRLMALLRDLERDEGRVKTAELLGISYRTLVRAVESGRLTGRMSDALERMLLSGGGSAAAQQPLCPRCTIDGRQGPRTMAQPHL